MNLHTHTARARRGRALAHTLPTHYERDATAGPLRHPSTSKHSRMRRARTSFARHGLQLDMYVPAAEERGRECGHSRIRTSRATGSGRYARSGRQQPLTRGRRRRRRQRRARLCICLGRGGGPCRGSQNRQRRHGVDWRTNHRTDREPARPAADQLEPRRTRGSGTSPPPSRGDASRPTPRRSATTSSAPNDGGRENDAPSAISKQVYTFLGCAVSLYVASRFALDTTAALSFIAGCRTWAIFELSPMLNWLNSEPLPGPKLAVECIFFISVPLKIYDFWVSSYPILKPAVARTE